MGRKSRKSGKPRKNRPRARIGTLASDVIGDIRQLHKDPLANELFKDWQAIEVEGSPEMLRIAKIQDETIQATAFIFHNREQSTLTVTRESAEGVTERVWRLSASEHYKSMLLEEKESFPGIPELQHGCKIMYSPKGVMTAWGPYTSFQYEGGEATSDGQYVGPATPFLNAPKGHLFTASATFHTQEGPLKHAGEMKAVLLPAETRPSGRAEIIVNYKIKPLAPPSSWLSLFKKTPSEHLITFGPFPLRLTLEDIENLVRDKVKKVLSSE